MTWTNNKQGQDVVWERLDRGFANCNWFRNHDDAQLINLPVTLSNHGAMVIFTKKEKPFLKRPYRFKAMLLTNSECENVVKKNVNVNGSLAFMLTQKIKLVRNEVKK